VECHTLERSFGDENKLSVYALLSCGPGIEDEVVKTYIEQEYKQTFFMYSSNDELAPCFENLLHTSKKNLEVIMQVAASLRPTYLLSCAIAILY